MDYSSKKVEDWLRDSHPRCLAVTEALHVMNCTHSSAALEDLDEFCCIFLAQSSAYTIGNVPFRNCYIINRTANATLRNQTITINHVCNSLHSCANVSRPFQIREGSSGSNSNSNS